MTTLNALYTLDRVMQVAIVVASAALLVTLAVTITGALFGKGINVGRIPARLAWTVGGLIIGLFFTGGIEAVLKAPDSNATTTLVVWTIMGGALMAACTLSIGVLLLLFLFGLEEKPGTRWLVWISVALLIGLVMASVGLDRELQATGIDVEYEADGWRP